MLASIRTRKYIVDKINANSRSWSWQMIFRQSNRNVFYQMLLTSFMCVLVIGLFDSKLKDQRGSNQFESDYRISEKTHINSHSPKIILFWTKYYNSSDFHFGLGSHPFSKAGCSSSNCKLTNDRKLLNQSDVIIFHTNEIDDSDLPQVRYPHQKWIFYTFIPPMHYKALPETLAGQFNWTMTYRKDSDIVNRHPFGRLVEFKPHLRVIAAQSMASKQLFAKKKLVAWITSTCQTSVKRENFVRELQNYIDVDVYGGCGSKQCGTINDCNEMMARDYKFVLSLEHTLCTDFISEKMFWALESGSVPVVYGKANYQEFAPPHSYIDINEFSSPKALADHLIMLGSDSRMYHRYFEWKDNYKVERYPTNGWCDLCEKLNDALYVSQSQFYEDINEWWMGKATCETSYPHLETL